MADAPDKVVDEAIRDMHGTRYLSFLSRWSEQLRIGDHHLDEEWGPPGVRADTPVFARAFQVAREAVRTAVSAAGAVAEGEQMAYALCRPPGHHAGPSWHGGYCFLNNAVASARSLSKSVGRVGLLDIDFHFGNGSSALLAQAEGIEFACLHATTVGEYPWNGAGVPEGQLEVAFDSEPDAADYLLHLRAMVDELVRRGCSALVVSIGYDILGGDPHGCWSFSPSIYPAIGQQLARPSLPVCLVQEGGYHPPVLADAAHGLLQGLRPLNKEGHVSTA